jgi:hypothetical protein
MNGLDVVKLLENARWECVGLISVLQVAAQRDKTRVDVSRWSRVFRYSRCE